MRLKWLCLIGMLILTTSCAKKKKNEDKPPEIYRSYADDSLVKHFSFLPGTYWVYIDSISHKTDSVVVAASFIDSQEMSGYKGSYFYMYYVQSMVVNEYIIDTNGSSLQQKWIWQFLGSEAYIRSVGHYLPFSIQHPFFTYKSGRFYISETDTLTDSLLVTSAGITYTNVTEIIDNNSSYSPFFKDTMYVSPDVGIVKMSASNYVDSLRHIWELQRFYIAR